jgi:hypothetical protein
MNVVEKKEKREYHRRKLQELGMGNRDPPYTAVLVFRR